MAPMVNDATTEMRRHLAHVGAQMRAGELPFDEDRWVTALSLSARATLSPLAQKYSGRASQPKKTTPPEYGHRWSVSPRWAAGVPGEPRDHDQHMLSPPLLKSSRSFLPEPTLRRAFFPES
eukprot:5425644-Pyramimonas_sp.AAC.1